MNRINRSLLLAGLLAFGAAPALAQSATTPAPSTTPPPATTRNPSDTSTTTTSTQSNGSALTTPAQNADGTFNASEVIGMTVVNNSNDSIGRIGELLVDKNGQVSGVIVDVGGFLGIGSHRVMLPWNQVQLTNHNGSIQAQVNADKDTLKQMPEYKS
ncbi:MAG TPA: PRC-barrel domain-containing protein [Candidatus Cybelea sp.]|nr:PRC-barrel domain-containing protein [Candidatus Cybelea sp.]